MAGKNKSKVQNSAALKALQQEKALKIRFTQRIKALLELYGGSELLTKIPAIYIDKLFSLRYTVLKVKPASGQIIEKANIVKFNKLMNLLIENEFIELDNGNLVPLSWYATEVLTLIDAMTQIKPEDAEFETIAKHFLPYFPDTEIYNAIQDKLISIITDTTRFLSDFNKEIFRVTLDEAAVFNRFCPQNDLLIHAFKPEPVKLVLNGEKHSAIQLGWVDHNLKWKMLKVKASALGFKVDGLDIPLDVFVQNHALMRLKERINIIPGVIHEILMRTFGEKSINHVWQEGKSLVEFRVSDEKVGYLIVKLHSNKLVVHTFLFLTNDQTPEGEKLRRLLEIERADKKYLQIDNLTDFNAYHIYNNEKLSQLFKDAGCGSLLKLSHLKEFSETQVSDKNSDSIERYLADAPYFIKKLE
ncbi:MAG: hypothetical protein V4687_03450 [Bacteroidota bacterium]